MTTVLPTSVATKSGFTCYGTKQDQQNLCCVHCGAHSNRFVKDTHFRLGGSYFRCPNGCRDARNVEFYYSWKNVNKRRKNYPIHEYEFGGFQKNP